MDIVYIGFEDKWQIIGKVKNKLIGKQGNQYVLMQKDAAPIYYADSLKEIAMYASQL